MNASLLSSLLRYARRKVPVLAEPAIPMAAPAEADDWGLVLVDFPGGLTGAALRVALEAAGQGNPQAQAQVFQEIQEREPIIGAHLQTRKLAVTGCGWSVTSTDNTKRAAEVQAMLKAAGLDAVLMHLLDFIGVGYAGAVIDWGEGGKAVTGFRAIQPTAWDFDLGGNPALFDATGKPHPLAEYHPAQFLTVMNRGKPGLPCRNGLLRALAWFYLLKHTNLKHWGRFVEKFGIPFVVGKMADAQFGDAPVRNAILKALKQIGADGAGVTTASTAIEMLNTATGSNSDAFERFCRYVDEVYTLLVLGQLATSDTAGGLSKGGEQGKVRQDLLEADAMALIDAVQRQVVTPLCQFRWGMDDPGDILFWIDFEPPEDLTAKATLYQVLSEATGRKLDPNMVAKEFGVKFQNAPPEPPTQPSWPGAFPARMPPDMGTGMGMMDLADAVGHADARERALEAIVAEALRRTVDEPAVLQAWLGPVVTATRAAFADLTPDSKLEDLKARIPQLLEKLPGLFNEMDSAAFERHLSAAMLAAALNGYVAGSGPRRPF